MRLINTETLVAEEFIGSQIPKYAILSHTWEANEATFADLNSKSLAKGGGPGAVKVRWACSVARRDGYKYTWVDTCCIDKSSSSELTEAINSMFKWYGSAEVCHVYLCDLRPEDPTDRMGKCRWFSRGWTLQELIAPKAMKFYDKTGRFRGTKAELLVTLVQKTNVPEGILTGRDSLKGIPIGTRMSWAAHRTTTRQEDTAYCLLGIFDVNIPLIYGEGPKAFIRLQEEIIRQTNDLTIFYWKEEKKSRPGNEAGGNENKDTGQYQGVLADSPIKFKYASSLKSGPHATVNLDKPEFTITNKGIRINMPLVPFGNSGLVFMYLVPTRAPPDGSVIDKTLSGILLKRYGDGLYARANPTEIPRLSHNILPGARPAQRYLTKVLAPEDLVIVNPPVENTFKFLWRSDDRFYEYVSTTPSQWWDNEQKLFLAGNNSHFVACHLFRTSWETEARDLILEDRRFPHHRFILVFGISRDAKAWFFVWKEKTSDSTFRDVLEWGDLGNIQEWGEEAFDGLAEENMYEMEDTQTIELFKQQVPATLADQPETKTHFLKTEIDISLKQFRSNAGWQVEIQLRSRGTIDEFIDEDAAWGLF